MEFSGIKEGDHYLNKLVISMEKYQYNKREINNVVTIINDLSRHSIVNLDKYISKLIHSLSSKEQFGNIIVEGEIASFFYRKEFQVTFYPFGKKGVDLKIGFHNYQVFVEVSHFIDDYDTNEKLKKGKIIDGHELLVSYNGKNGLETLNDKITDELKQLPKNEMGIIALKSDNVRIEDIEFEQIIDDLNIQAKVNDTLNNLSGVLFDSSWYSSGKRFYFWRNMRAIIPIDEILLNQLR